MARVCDRTGMNGLTIWGEPSPYHATVELSYLAFARFSWNPGLSFEDFVEQDAAPRLGGLEAAQRFIAMAEELDAAQTLPSDRLETLRQAAAEHRAGGEIGRRWLSLEDQITRRLYMGA
jgi:hypothetical protein